MGKLFGLVYPSGFLEHLERKESSVFEGKSQPRSEVLESIIREVGSWLLVVKEFKGMSLSDMALSWPLLLEKPSLAVPPRLALST